MRYAGAAVDGQPVVVNLGIAGGNAVKAGVVLRGDANRAAVLADADVFARVDGNGFTCVHALYAAA